MQSDGLEIPNYEGEKNHSELNDKPGNKQPNCLGKKF